MFTALTEYTENELTTFEGQLLFLDLVLFFPFS